MTNLKKIRKINDQEYIYASWERRKKYYYYYYDEQAYESR